MKRVALATLPSIVNVVSRTGGKSFFVCSGTIIDCVHGSNGTYGSTILTSASLFCCETSLISYFWEHDTVPEDIELETTLADGRCFKAIVSCYDFHYNFALLSIHTDVMLPTARLRLLDDCMSLDPQEVSTPSSSRSDQFQLRSHSSLFKISAGDMVVALGRHSMKPHMHIAVPGTLSLYRCDLDCMELFTANCRIPRAGVGDLPVMKKQNGEKEMPSSSVDPVTVVGSYDHQRSKRREDVPDRNGDGEIFAEKETRTKCLDYFKRHGKFCRPSLGLDVHNLYAARVNDLEVIIRKFPNTFKGVIVHQF